MVPKGERLSDFLTPLFNQNWTLVGALYFDPQPIARCPVTLFFMFFGVVLLSVLTLIAFLPYELTPEHVPRRQAAFRHKEGDPADEAWLVSHPKPYPKPNSKATTHQQPKLTTHGHSYFSSFYITHLNRFHPPHPSRALKPTPPAVPWLPATVAQPTMPSFSAFPWMR